MITSPSWAATGQNSAEIDAFLSSSSFQLVDTDVMFRFFELVSPDTNTSSHILIDGLVPLEEGSNEMTSNYRGIDISTGEVFDSGQVLLTLPAGVSGDGASSPIVGIVSRPNGWDGFNPEPPPSSTVGESAGTFAFDTDAMEIDFMLTQGAKTIQGTTTYTVDTSTWAVTLAPFTLNDGTNDYAFGSTILEWDGMTYYGLIVSEDASPGYESLMFALRLYSPDGDGDGMPMLVDTDGDMPSSWNGFLIEGTAPNYYVQTGADVFYTFALPLPNTGWIYSYRLTAWVYLPEPWVQDGEGFWFYMLEDPAGMGTSGDQWAGYDVDEANGARYVVTGSYLYTLEFSTVNPSWAYSFRFQRWFYFPDEPAAPGTWIYLNR